METVLVNGTNLHYVSRGTGHCVVFIHGGLEDVRWWEPHADHFGQHYRAIAYSRRHNYPNSPTALNPEHSAITEAADLAKFITQLNLGRVHAVGASYGAYTALWLAIKRPDLIRSLVLSEPPLISWLPEIPYGQLMYQEFYEKWWTPAADAFRAGNIDLALRTTIDWWGSQGALMGDEPLNWDRMPDGARQMFREDADDLRAMVLSRNAFPNPSYEEVSRIDIPTLMLSGARTIPMHALIDPVLERTLPKARRCRVESAGHDMWFDQPEVCRSLTMEFIGSL